MWELRTIMYLYQVLHSSLKRVWASSKDILRTGFKYVNSEKKSGPRKGSRPCCRTQRQASVRKHKHVLFLVLQLLCMIPALSGRLLSFSHTQENQGRKHLILVIVLEVLVHSHLPSWFQAWVQTEMSSEPNYILRRPVSQNFYLLPIVLLLQEKKKRTLT